MGDALRSAVARAVEKFAAYIGSLPSASSSTPTCDIEKLREDTMGLVRMLDAIRATLDDAEKRGISGDFICQWLRQLQGLSYEAEDVLDEFAYEAMHLSATESRGFGPGSHGSDNLERGGSTGEMEVQVTRDLISSAAPSFDIFAFLNEVEQRIKVVYLRFDELKKHKQALSLDGNYEGRQFDVPGRQPTGSLTGPCFIGRTEDLKAVKRFLLSDGMPGANNSNIPVMAIVGMGGLGKTALAQHAYNEDEVDRHFPLKSWVCVSEDIDLVQLTKAMVESLFQKPSNLSRLDPLQRELKKELLGKNFLLVLDDIWDVENLSHIWDSLTSPLCHESTRTKIIITTRNEKVSKMLSVTLLYHLPCLKTTDSLKLFRRYAFQGRDPNSCQNLMGVAITISRRCRGLPLLVKTLGSLLRCEDDEQTWNEILDRDIWDIAEEKKVADILALSYQHLPPHLKRCFRYCSVFPKDHPFDKDQLVQMWMAHGYIQARGLRLIEDIGNEYFDDLLSRSFFQHSQTPNVFLMHDLIHDLARCVSQGECYVVEDDKNYGVPECAHHHISIVTIRHSVSISSVGNIPMSLTVRSLLFMAMSFYWDRHINIENDLFTRMKRLRVLDLRYGGLDKLPSSISNLKHLRFLGLHGNPIMELPASIGSLYHLQTLDLQDTNVKQLSVHISDLINLRHLIHDRSGLIYPAGMGKLTNLQSMPGFYVSGNNHCARLGELKDINNIRSLVIHDIDNLTGVDDAKDACLKNKERLAALDLRWSAYRKYSSRVANEVLESLRPCLKLKQLKIRNFCGESLPSWLGNPAFSSLASIELTGCGGWASLPPLGRLPSLKQLSISSANSAKYIGKEFWYGGFPQLQALQLLSMSSWQSWYGAQEGECPKLRELVISDCHSLASLLTTNLDALESLEISDCQQLCFSSKNQLPSALQALTIRGCPLLMKWCAREGECPKLKQLVIANCDSLASLSIMNLGALESLKVSNCHQLCFSSEIQLPSTLRALTVHGCPFLTKWCLRHEERLQSIAQLSIQGIDEKHVVISNLFSVQEAMDACLDIHKKLHRLELEWDCNVSNRSFENVRPEEILDNLRPHSNLNKLVIRGYAGSRFATWLGDPSLSSLVYVTLLGCSQCQLLPPLGQLPHLMELRIVGAHRLRHIGSEFYNTSSSNSCKLAFPSLEKLEFNDMPSWEEWEEMEGGYLPHLRELILKQCPMLKTLPSLPPSLRELEVANCDVITFPHSFDHLSSLCTMRVSHLSVLQKLPDLPLGLLKLTLQYLPALVDLMAPPSLRHLVLEGCNEAMVAASLPHLIHLSSLNISYFPELKRLPLHNLVILRSLRVCNCPELLSFDCFSFLKAVDEYIEGVQALKSLESLFISGCPKLHFSANERPPSTLIFMDIINCPSLVAWFGKHWTNRIKVDM